MGRLALEYSAMETIDVQEAAARIQAHIKKTPLLPFPIEDERLELRLKLECLQETNAFKTRGATNQIACLTSEERAAGVVASSSGNHGQALAWAARMAGVQATICMPQDSYPNKIAACESFGAKVVLTETREMAEVECLRRIENGAIHVPPYDSARTIAGAGTVGLEIGLDWPEVEILLVPVGGGGLISGCVLAMQQLYEQGHLKNQVKTYGVEPEGAPSMTLALEAGKPVPLTAISTNVQGLCPPASGELNTEICRKTLAGMFTLSDEKIFEAQKSLVHQGGWVVEPAGAAAPALILGGALPDNWLENRSVDHPLKVAAVVSGGNPNPKQLKELQAT